jgi:Domain of unknown function (DUF4149)
MLKLRIAILGFWIGVIALFSFIVAPSAFAVMPSASHAGAMVSRVLGAVEVIGIGAGIVLLFSALFSRNRLGRIRSLEIVAYSITLIAMLFSRFYVSSRLHDIRTRLGDSLASLPSTDIARTQFDILHRVSVGSLSLCLLIALAILAILIVNRPHHA